MAYGSFSGTSPARLAWTRGERRKMSRLRIDASPSLHPALSQYISVLELHFSRRSQPGPSVGLAMARQLPRIDGLREARLALVWTDAVANADADVTNPFLALRRCTRCNSPKRDQRGWAGWGDVCVGCLTDLAPASALPSARRTGYSLERVDACTSTFCLRRPAGAIIFRPSIQIQRQLYGMQAGVQAGLPEIGYVRMIYWQDPGNYIKRARPTSGTARPNTSLIPS
ncbi:hypothetical protein B0H14DRAFT_2556209 [Mycena olivaceomarginata]|nr:hypothetical protein B0H14DRAFT_2556209 [Mycena olivaceomarginata]